MGLVNECPADLGERLVQKLLPALGVALVDPPLSSPPGEHVACFFNHRFAESSRDGPVVSEAARAGAFVVAPLSVLLKALKIEALRRFALTDHRRCQDISAIAVRAISLHGLVKIEERGHGHLDTTLSRVDEGKISRLDPAIERCVADPQYARSQPAGHCLAQFPLERAADCEDICVAGQVPPDTTKTNDVFE